VVSALQKYAGDVPAEESRGSGDQGWLHR
jgi:hypothetical protein